MRRTLAIASLFVAWICANGAVWDVVQIFAWARMFTGYTQTQTVTAAIEETFDGSKPCPICRAVAKAKEAAHKQAPQSVERSAEKLLLACEFPEKLLIGPSADGWPDAAVRSGPVRIEPVPVPPPRA